MIQSLFTGITGLQTHQQLLNAISNNLANVNTPAFKRSRALFQDSLSQVYSPPSAGSATQAGTNGVQMGLGVSLATVTAQQTQGALQATNNPTDIAIEGEGFMVVRDPALANGYLYTRDGAFAIDSNNYLVNPAGYRVQGFQVPDQSAPTAPVDGGAYQDIVIAPDATQSATLVNFTIESTGRVLMQLSDGNTIPVAYLAMNNFSNPEGLIARGKTMFEASAASGKLYNGFKGPGTDGMGLMRAGYLELSNVDLASEFTDMIRSQRGLQANARTITTSDEILQELIQLKR